MSLSQVFATIRQGADAPLVADGAAVLPWAEAAFSARFAERVDYVTRFGHPSPVRQVDALERQLGLGPGAAVLDLCSGPGPHAIELARRGHRVLAVDIGPGAVALGRRRAAEAGVCVTFVSADVTGGPEPVGDALAALGPAADAAFVVRGQVDNFAPSDLARLARNLAAWLRPGGAVALEFTQPGRVAKRPNQSWHVSEARDSIWGDDACLVLTQSDWDAARAQERSTFFVLHADGRLERHRSSTQTYTRGAIAAIVRAAGFGRIRFEPGDARWTRLVAIRRAP